MWDKFGEFDSAEELNRAAAAQKAEGDREALITLAEENGIDREDAEDYLDGAVDELATPLMAALGKLKVEAKELELEGMMMEWLNCITEQCRTDERMQAAVREKGKSLRDCVVVVIQYSFENKRQVSDKIMKHVKIKKNGKMEPYQGPLYIGYPTQAKAKELIREYYLEEQS